MYMFNRKKVTAIVQARMGSSRLPGKILKCLGSKTCLEHVVTRLKRTKTIGHVIVAIPDNFDEVSALYNYIAKELDCGIYLGDEVDVLKRVTHAAYVYNSDVIVDITADCPLIDPEIIDKAYSIFHKKKLDYIANIKYEESRFHIGNEWPDGLDFQIYTRHLLEQLDFLVPPGPHRTHTGWNVREHRTLLEQSIGRELKVLYYGLQNECSQLADWDLLYHPDWGLTLDTKEDLHLLTRLFSYFEEGGNSEFTYRDVCELLIKNPKLLELNKNVKRKHPGEG